MNHPNPPPKPTARESHIGLMLIVCLGIGAFAGAYAGMAVDLAESSTFWKLSFGATMIGAWSITIADWIERSNKSNLPRKQ